MIADIANELHRVRREVMKMGLPDWMIYQALRIEINEYALLEAWHREGSPSINPMRPPTEIMGVRVYAIQERFGAIPAPGWRIINPFEQKRIPMPKDKREAV